MSFIRIIPSLLLLNKKLVKGTNFKNYKNAGNPKTTISALNSQKADEIFITDIEGYKGNEPDYLTLNEISKTCNTPMTFAGGLNELKKIKKAFKNGADKIYICSALHKNIKLIEKTAKIFGSQSVVGGVNVIKEKNKYYLFNQKNNINPIDFANFLVDSGIGELKVTFVNLEGTRKGLDLNFCSKINSKISIPIIFEGGIGNLNDIESAIKIGVKNIALGTMIIFSDYNIFKIKQHLFNKGMNVRI